MACRSFLLAKHDAIPDLNSNYILFPETQMDLSDTSEFLLVIQVLRCLRGYNPPATFSLFFLQGAELITSVPPLQITNFPFPQCNL